MEMKLPKFFQELAGRVVVAELTERNTARLILPSAYQAEGLEAVTTFCKEVGLRLDLSDIGTIDPPADDPDYNASEYQKLVIENIAVFAATSLLSRAATVSLQLQEAEVEASGVTISVSISPFGGQSDRMLTTQLREDFGVEIPDFPSSEEAEEEVDLLGGQFTIGRASGSMLDGPVFQAFHYAASNWVHPIISSTPVDFVANAERIDPGCVPEDAEQAVAVAFAKILRKYFLGEAS